jgi:hypothetical protein
MDYLSFEAAESDDGIWALEACASTAPAQHAAVMAEVQQALDWAWQQFPNTHGPVEDGADWHHDLQVSVEGGQWHAVTLTLAASTRFAEAFLAVFGAA